MTGLWLAATAPERITSLAVCCAALTALPSPQAWHDRAALVRAEGMAPLAAMAVPRWFTPEFMAREPAAVQTVTDMLIGDRARGLRRLRRGHRRARPAPAAPVGAGADAGPVRRR